MANILNVNVEDLAKTYEDSLDEAKDEWYETKIDEAARLLISKVPSIPARVAEGRLDTDVVKDIVLKATMRVIRNAKGLTQIGEATVNMSLNPLVSSGDLWYSKAELAMVALPVKRPVSQSVGIIQMRQWW